MGGGIYGYAVPKYVMKPWCKVFLPYTIVAGIGAGICISAFALPLFAIEGAFDTVTGGAFTDEPFSWFISEKTGAMLEENQPDVNPFSGLMQDTGAQK